MADILHRVGTTAARDTVYQALTTVDGLAAWWTTDTEGSGDDLLRFRFGDVGGFDMKVLELQPDTRVRWEVVDGPEEWVGTTVTFDLKQEGEWTVVLFAHEGWREQVEFMNHCTTKWALFLMSLKSLVETGTGAPHPHDVRISNWH
ncbi:SRPBCC domain-containing protein [Streptomyces sp. NPDC059618]|uniref:SRPBCC family protein n=1 Tax=unclassified Streptomyces TaxID=2593676 RepID=UPI003664DD07